MSLGSRDDLGLMSGMDYRGHQSTSDHAYRGGQSSPPSGMASGGLVRSSNGHYPNHYSHMPSSAPPDHGYDNAPFTSNQHVSYSSVGLPPLVDKTRSKLEEYSQDNTEGGMEGDSGSIYVAKSSNLRNSGSYVSSMTPSSPANMGSKNDSHPASPNAYNQALPPMGSQQSAFYMFPGGGNTNTPSKDMQGYDNGDMNPSRNLGIAA